MTEIVLCLSDKVLTLPHKQATWARRLVNCAIFIANLQGKLARDPKVSQHQKRRKGKTVIGTGAEGAWNDDDTTMEWTDRLVFSNCALSI